MKTEKGEIDLKPKDQNIEEKNCPCDFISNNILPSQHFESAINATSSQFSEDLRNIVAPLQANTISLTRKRVYENSQNPLVTHNSLSTAISSNLICEGESSSTEGEHFRPDQRLANHDSSDKYLSVSHLPSTSEPSTSSQPYDIDKLSVSFYSKHDTHNKGEDNEISVSFVQSLSSTDISSSGAAQLADCCTKKRTNILADKIASSCTDCHIVPSTTSIGCIGEDLESEDDWPDFPHSPPSPSHSSSSNTLKKCVSFITKEMKSFKSSTSNATKTTVSSSTSLQKREKNGDNEHVGFANCLLPLSLPYENSCDADASIDGAKSSSSFDIHPSNVSRSSFLDIIVPNRISNSSLHSSNTEQNHEHAFPCSQSCAFKSLPSYSQYLVRSENNPQASGCSAPDKMKDGNLKGQGNLLDVQAISSNDKTPCYWLFAGSTSARRSRETLEDVATISRRARALVAEGIDPRRRDINGCTPAHDAAKKGCAATLSALLYLGADPDAKDVVGWRPLHYASRYNHSTCVALLVARGAHVEARNAAGKSPLHVAAASCAREATRALLAAGANNKSRDENGTTPLDVAHSVAVRRERLVGRLSGRFLSRKGFGHWTNWRHLLEKERKIRDMLNNVHRQW